ncbi:MAG TPA: FAD-dependent oxidoreductase [Alphaproteobacteria bacterium]|nr:FAD-dependent oxidoreductase [Alphaproteobacteria bacterium]
MGLDIAVIGAGIVGMCCAAYLRRDGHRVTVLDPVAPGGSCSFGNLGSLSPGSCVPLATPGILTKIPRMLVEGDRALSVAPARALAAAPWLARFVAAARPARVAAAAKALSALHSRVFEAYAPLLAWADANDLVRRAGQLYVFESESDFAHARFELDLRRAHGERQETIDGDEIRQLEPALAAGFARGVFLPDAGHCIEPKRLVELLAAALVRDGGMILPERVNHVAVDAGKVVLTIDHGVHRADRVIIASGAWSNRLLQLLCAEVPLESLRGYHAVLRNCGATPRMAIRFARAKIMATPMATGLRVGGTVEIAGLDAPPTPGRARKLAALGAKVFPGADPNDFSEWMGHRPGTPDSLPVIGALRRHPAVYCAFGHGQTGLTGAASTGELIAAIIGGRNPPIDAAPYSPRRFGA